MLCEKPFKQGLAAFPCGQCLPCRYNRRRMWTHRLLLEGKTHGDSCVATLTYNEENHPADGSLNPRHTTLWLKRLRERLRPLELRYFYCGEYGDQTWRPHYHAVLFGLSPTAHAEVIDETWGHGFTYVDSLTWESAQYVMGYVTKKLTKENEWTNPRLQGRHPEFSRMSRHPGIGAKAMQTVARSVSRSRAATSAIGTYGDVPTVLQHSRKQLPLGRYLRSKLRTEMGFTDGPAVPEAFKVKRAQELRALCEAVGVAAAIESLKLAPELVKIKNLKARLRATKGKSL